MEGKIVPLPKPTAWQGHQLVSAANFVVQKALAKLKIFESEATILEEHLRMLEEDIKKQKIKNFIAQQHS